MKVLILFVFGVVCASAAIISPVPSSNETPSNSQPSINQPSNSSPSSSEPSNSTPSSSEPSNSTPSSSEPPTSQLDSDLDELVALIPIDKIIILATQYMSIDSTFLNTMIYLTSPEVNEMILEAINTTECNAIIQYLNDSGYDITRRVDDFKKAHEMTAYSQDVNKDDATSMMNSFYMAVFNILPKSEISAFIVNKLETSPAYKTFFTRVRAPAFYILVQQFLNAPQVAFGLAAMKTHGVDVRETMNLFSGVMGL